MTTHKSGQESMRRRAAEVCRERAQYLPAPSGRELRIAAEAILALPLTEAEPAEQEPNPSAIALKDRILAERDKGNLVFMAMEDSLVRASVDVFVRQPVDGILYDLNRGEEVILTFIHDRKWVNDFAVALTIRKLVEQRDAAEAARTAEPAPEPVAWRFFINGDWFASKTLDGAKRALMLAGKFADIQPLYAAPAEDARDGEIGRWMLKNCAWHRGDEQGDSIVVYVAKGSDLSCVATRRLAVEAAMKGAAK